MTDTDANGQWVWNSDGSMVSWTFWAPREPMSANCAKHIHYINNDNDKKWFSASCGESCSVICERSKYTIYHLTKETNE